MTSGVLEVNRRFVDQTLRRLRALSNTQCGVFAETDVAAELPGVTFVDDDDASLGAGSPVTPARLERIGALRVDASWLADVIIATSSRPSRPANGVDGTIVAMHARSIAWCEPTDAEH